MFHLPLPRLAVAVAIWAGLHSDARADEFESTRSELLVERGHEIRLTMHYGHAELRVRRKVFNGGARADQAMFWIDMPQGGVAVGLRTLAMRRGKPHWYDGDLLPAELAAERYRELTGIGGYTPKDPALLSWRSADRLLLQVFPCLPRQAKSVEYSLVVPTIYRAGQYQLELPQMGTESARAVVTVQAASPRDRLFVDDQPIEAGATTEMRTGHRFALARVGAPTFTRGLAVAPLAEEGALVRYHLDVAPQLSRVPVGADVVVLVDRSRSMPERDRVAALALAHAYLSNFAGRQLDARAALVAFDRQPKDLSGGLVPVGEVVTRLETMTLEGRNGSHVDRALGQAEKLLVASRSRGARRVVVLTDRRIRSSLKLSSLEALARRTRALVHVVDVTEGELGLTRVEGDPWAPVARATGGVLWRAGVDLAATDLRAVQRTFVELARPVRLHRLAVTIPGVVSNFLAAPETLDEGESLSRLLLVDRAIDQMVVTGERWAKPVRQLLRPDARQAKLWSALAFGTEVIDELSERDLMALAVAGGAVSPVTSYLAIEPGVRPSTEGLEHGESSGFGLGTLGGAGGVGRGFHRGNGSMDLQRFFKDHLADAAKTCAASRGAARAVVETTFGEVVDVASVQAGGDPSVEDCVREALWAVEVPAAAPAFASTKVEVP